MQPSSHQDEENTVKASQECINEAKVSTVRGSASSGNNSKTHVQMRGDEVWYDMLEC